MTKNENGEMYKGNTKKIMQLNNQFEADLLMDILIDNGIPAIIEEYNDQIFGETFNEFKGWGDVWAEPKYEDQIKQFVEEIRNQHSSEPFDESIDEDLLDAMDADNTK